MNLKNFKLIGSLSALMLGGSLAISLAPLALHAQDEQSVEELTRGPVHEAFAAAVTFDPEPGMFVKTSPPELIEEIPPEQELEGENVTWIPGYWGWDEEQNDFLWISGVWRNLPPGREWIPGYWAENSGQWQWTSGYWQDEETKEVTYLPQPPKSIETGPNVQAPSSSHIWVSGTWVNRESRYAWRPGYWEPGQENWTWIPAHYQWTPRGYIFIEGYWDYQVARRGVVFAPVRVRHEYYNRSDYSYRPTTVINLAVFINHLFVRPSYGHYYFGDYYSPRYRDEGFYASYSYHSGRRGYDPFYEQARWEHRKERDWDRQRKDDFNYYLANEDARPPRTWAMMKAMPEGRRKGSRDNYEFAQPLSRYVEQSSSKQKFKLVTAEKRTQLVSQRQEIRKYAKEREKVEIKDEKNRGSGDKDKVMVVRRDPVVKSPVASKRRDEFKDYDLPPKRREGGKKLDEPSEKPNKVQKDKSEQGDDHLKPDQKDKKIDQGQPMDHQDKRDRKTPATKPEKSDQKEMPGKINSDGGPSKGGANKGQSEPSSKPEKSDKTNPRPEPKPIAREEKVDRRKETTKTVEKPRRTPEVTREKTQQPKTPKNEAKPKKSDEPDKKKQTKEKSSSAQYRPAPEPQRQARSESRPEPKPQKQVISSPKERAPEVRSKDVPKTQAKKPSKESTERSNKKKSKDEDVDSSSKMNR